MPSPTLAPRTVVHTNIALRGLQFLASLAAMVLLTTGFRDMDNFSHRLGSRSADFLLLMSYSSMLYAAWLLVCVELCGLATRPRILMMRAMDASAVAVLLLAGIVMARVDLVRECEAFGPAVHCKTLHASVCFTFIAMVLFAASIALTFVKIEADTAVEVTDYVIETTPTHAVYSPRPAVNAPPTPSTKV